MSYASGVNNMQVPVRSVDAAESNAPVQSNGAGRPAPSAVPMEHSDKTQLSSAADTIAQSLNTSDVRTEKVASLQQAIAAGTYSVPASDVADKIIQSLLG